MMKYINSEIKENVRISIDIVFDIVYYLVLWEISQKTINLQT